MSKEFFALSDELMHQLSGKGCLLVTGKQAHNVMTIGWGACGYFWRTPVFVLPVRESRFSFEKLEELGEFTVNVGKSAAIQDALVFAGTNTGREVDKITELGLTMNPSKKISVPIVDGCEIYLECRVLYKQLMDKNALAEKVAECYAEPDYHMMFFSEVLAAYRG